MRCVFSMLIVIAGFAIAGQSVQAHTIAIGYTNNGDGSVTFYAGTFHLASEVASPVGGLTISSGPAGIGTYAFTGSILPGSLPTLDGLFVDPSSDIGDVNVWQTVTVSGLISGDYETTTTKTSFVEWPISDDPFPLSLSVTSSDVPEPTSLALFALTALGMGVIVRRRRRTGTSTESPAVS